MALKSEPSVVPGILLSDVSILEQGTQKRSIVGCFDRFVFQQFPATYGRFFITAWIGNIVGSLSEMDLTFRIEEKGSSHVVFSGSMHMDFKQERTFDGTVILGANMVVQGMIFQKPGIYTVILLLNGEEVGRRDFSAILHQQPKEPLKETSEPTQ